MMGGRVAWVQERAEAGRWDARMALALARRFGVRTSENVNIVTADREAMLVKPRLQ